MTAVFGGFFIGAGIGLAIRRGAVLNGTEIAALFVGKSSNLLKVGDVILVLNVFIFAAAAFFLGIESALYSMLSYFAASKTVARQFDEGAFIVVHPPGGGRWRGDQETRSA